MSTPIPIIDLFAGPGGLGEGFSRYPMGSKKKAFRIAVSIEKDPYAHKTLTLRDFFREFFPTFAFRRHASLTHRLHSSGAFANTPPPCNQKPR